MKQRAAEGFRLLSLEPHHLYSLVDLPFHHRDPFDRLLISQAIAEKMAVCTGDANFGRYPIHVVW